MKKIIFVILTLTLTACNPLKKTQRTQITDDISIDKSEIQKLVTEAIREQGKMTQTVIEYYPAPDTSIPVTAEDAINKDPITAEPTVIKLPPVQRIIHTEISTNTEKEKTVDSTMHKNIEATSARELHDKVVEKPPSSVIIIRWLVIGLLLILIIIIVLKNRHK